jgi:alcohol dehydrogenase
LQVFDLFIPSHLKFGLDVVNRIGNVASSFGKKVMLVTEGILHENKSITRIDGLLRDKGCEVLVFEDVVPNATSDVVAYGAKLAKSSYTEVVIGMGGVRALSIAKAIAMLATNPHEISDYFDSEVVTEPSLPYIEIPTTPRNPFMFRDELWLTDSRNRNSKIIKLQPNSTKYVLFDPILTTSLPRRFVATTIVDTLANAIEGYLSTSSNFLSDILFIQSIELFSKHINTAVTIPDDLNARSFLSLGGLMTSMGLNMANTGVCAAISYVLNSKYKIHKSLTSSVMLPFVMDFNITASPNKLVRIAQALGENIADLTVVDAAIKSVERIRKLIIELQLPVKLEEFGLTKDEMITVADEARKFESFNFLPRTCTSEELYAILQAAY